MGNSATEVIDIIDDMALNETKENEGVWFPYRGDVEFLIAKKGNNRYRARLAYLWKKNAKLLEANNDASRAKADELMVDVTARTILLGWKGTFKIAGEPAGDYSVDKAEALLKHKLFKEWVDNQADDVKAFLLVQEEEDEKN